MSENTLKMIYLTLGLLVVVMFYVLFPLADATEVILVVSLSIMAWVAYQYLQPWLIMRRQAYIGLTVKEESRLQAFRSSLLIDSLAAMLAIMAALGSLWVVAGFGRIINMPYFEWALLTLSILSFVLIYSWLDKKSDQHLNEGFRFIVLWPTYFINLALIVLAYVVVFIFFADMPNYTTQSWSDIFELAKAQSSAQMEWVEWLLALDMAIQHFLYAGLQRLSLTESDESLVYVVGAKLLIWVLVLAFAALKFGLVWGVMLGMVAYVLKQLEQRQEQDPAVSGFSKGFLIGLGGLFVLYFLISQINIGGLFYQAVTPLAQQQVLIEPTCKPSDVEREMEVLRDNIDKKLNEQQLQLQAQFDQKIDEIVDDIFDHPKIEAGIEAFLDWNFSVVGSYQQLFFKGAELFDQAGLEVYLADKFSELAGDAIEEVVAERLQPLDDLFLAEAQTLINNITRHESAENNLEGCLNIDALDFNLDFITINYAGGGGVAGVIAARVSAKVVAQISAKVAAQIAAKAMAKAGTQVAGRVASIAAGSAAAGAALIPCAATGPAVALCAGAVGVGVGVATWLGVDTAIVSLDELFNRDELRQIMYESLDEQKQILKAELKETYSSQINEMILEVQQQTFRVIELVK